jgi:transposase
MNKLPIAKRAQILTLLCEGMSMRSIERIVGCSINTIDKLLQDAGEVALEYHDKHVRGVTASRIQCDEVWSFVHAKQKNAPTSKRAGDPTIGDCWTYVERANLTMRMSMRRFTRLTNAFSKKLTNHAHMVALYALWYNFVRIHKTLRMSPAMAAGIETRLWSMEDIAAMLDEHAQRNAPKLADRLVG